MHADFAFCRAVAPKIVPGRNTRAWTRRAHPILPKEVARMNSHAAGPCSQKNKFSSSWVEWLSLARLCCPCCEDAKWNVGLENGERHQINLDASDAMRGAEESQHAYDIRQDADTELARLYLKRIFFTVDGRNYQSKFDSVLSKYNDQIPAPLILILGGLSVDGSDFVLRLASLSPTLKLRGGCGGEYAGEDIAI